MKSVGSLWEVCGSLREVCGFVGILPKDLLGEILSQGSGGDLLGGGGIFWGRSSSAPSDQVPLRPLFTSKSPRT